LVLRYHMAVAFAFFRCGVCLLSLFLLILFHEANLWCVAADSSGQIFLDGSVSNRQLQLTTLAAGAWCAWLAWRTRTVALSSVSTLAALLVTLALLGDVGLRSWVDEARFDRLGLHLAPLVAAYAVAAWALDRSGRPWFGRPLYVGAAALLVVVLELVALDGRLFGYLGVTLTGLQGPGVSDPTLVDTATAMTVNGLVFYAVASALERLGRRSPGEGGSETMQVASAMLFTIAPFAVLEPLGYLAHTGEYSRGVDWFYLALAVGIAVLSHARQRKAFYYAGLVNSSWALWLIADHNAWFDQPRWAIALVAVGLAVLGAGFALASRERTRRAS